MKEIKVEQGSFEWLQARIGKIGGSRFDDVLGTPKAQHTLLCELIAEQMTEQAKEVKTSDAMERGKIEEGFARKQYEAEAGEKVETVGLIVADHIDPEQQRVIFSPDGVVRNDDGEIVGGLEIKNPDSKTHIAYLIEGGVPKDYIAQITMAFIAIPTAQWWDFVSFDSRVKLPARRLMVKRVVRSDLDIAGAEEALRAFLVNWDETYSKLVF